MPNIKRINPAGMKDTSNYGFAQAVVVPSGSQLVYIAGHSRSRRLTAGPAVTVGQGGADENGNYGSFTEQIDRAFASLHNALTAVGATPEDVVKITILSVEHNEEKLDLISAKRKSFWLHHKPASTLIPVPRLASDGMLFEIDAITIISQSPDED